MKSKSNFPSFGCSSAPSIDWLVRRCRNCERKFVEYREREKNTEKPKSTDIFLRSHPPPPPYRVCRVWVSDKKKKRGKEESKEKYWFCSEFICIYKVCVIKRNRQVMEWKASRKISIKLLCISPLSFPSLRRQEKRQNDPCKIHYHEYPHTVSLTCPTSPWHVSPIRNRVKSS